MSKVEILAVHKRKLEEFLKRLELWESFSKGELKCCICEATISFNNLGFIIPAGSEILFCCSSVECILKTKELQSSKSE